MACAAIQTAADELNRPTDSSADVQFLDVMELVRRGRFSNRLLGPIRHLLLLLSPHFPVRNF